MYQRLIAPILKKRGRSVPSYEVLRYNASLVLGNTHVALGDAFAMPQAYKQIGGYHINKETVPLPEVGSFSSNIQNRNFILGNAEIITTITLICVIYVKKKLDFFDLYGYFLLIRSRSFHLYPSIFKFLRNN